MKSFKGDMTTNMEPAGYMVVGQNGRCYLRKETMNTLGVNDGDLIIYYHYNDWLMIHKMPTLSLELPTPGNPEKPK